MILELVEETHPLLYTKLNPFDFSKDNGVELAQNLYDTMLEHNGLGLSANQVGINSRVFVMGFRDQFKFNVFNPEIVRILGTDSTLDEGCLSFPGIFMRMKRPGSVHVKYYDEKGNKKEEVFSGMTARVFLHEYDHLEGITFKNRVSKMKWDFAEKRKLKRK